MTETERDLFAALVDFADQNHDQDRYDGCNPQPVQDCDPGCRACTLLDEVKRLRREETAIARLALATHRAKYNAVRDAQRQLGTTYAEALAMVDEVMCETPAGVRTARPTNNH